MYQLVIRVVLGLRDRAGGRERRGVGAGGGGKHSGMDGSRKIMR